MTKIFFKMQAIIMLVAILCALLIVGVSITNADCDNTVANLEYAEQPIDYQNIAGKLGVVTDINTVSKNKETFEEYINLSDGRVLVPDRDNSSEALAYQVVGFCDEGIMLYPIYTYSLVDKSQIDYEELFEDTISLQSNDYNPFTATDYMTMELSFRVYLKKYVGGYAHVGTVKMRMSVDYVPTPEIATFYGYIAKYEVCVMPTSKYAFQSFNMAILLPESTKMMEENSKTNHTAAVATTSFSFNTGLGIGVGVDIGSGGATVGIDKSGNIGINFGYSISAPKGSVNINRTGSSAIDGFKGSNYKVTRNDGDSLLDKSKAKGLSHSALYCAEYRMPKIEEGSGLAFRLENLSLWGQAGEVSYQESNVEKVIFISSWEKAFQNKRMMLLASARDGDQYFDNYEHKCSLPVESSVVGIVIYMEK